MDSKNDKHKYGQKEVSSLSIDEALAEIRRTPPFLADESPSALCASRPPFGLRDSAVRLRALLQVKEKNQSLEQVENTSVLCLAFAAKLKQVGELQHAASNPHKHECCE